MLTITIGERWWILEETRPGVWRAESWDYTIVDRLDTVLRKIARFRRG